jgi:hypothetical protein
MGAGYAPALGACLISARSSFVCAGPDPLQHPRRGDRVLAARASNRTLLADGPSDVASVARQREPQIGASTAARCPTLPACAMRQRDSSGHSFAYSSSTTGPTIPVRV